VACISENAVPRIIFRKGSGNFSSDDEVLMLFGKMALCHGSALAVVLAMNALFEPISDECACIRKGEPCALGAFLL